MTKHLFILFSLFVSITSYSQTFYVTYDTDIPRGNKGFQLSTTSCDSLNMFVCPPTHNPDSILENIFLDMAIDKQQNIYYVSAAGSLYKRNLNDTTTCQYLGTFNLQINSLVVDSENLIYGAGQVGLICSLYRYNISTGIFDTLGAFPSGFFSAGDLFFYEGKLFLTAIDSLGNESSLIQVDISDPSQSCYYMGLDNFQPWSAFSINFGSYSKAYILRRITYKTSSLIELDMTNKTWGFPICTYPFLPTGAAVYYNLTSSYSVCDTTSTLIRENIISPLTFIVQSPVSNSIHVVSNIDESKIVSINLFNTLGEKVKSYDAQILIGKLDASDISSGLYILQMVLSSGQTVTTKFIKQAP